MLTAAIALGALVAAALLWLLFCPPFPVVRVAARMNPGVTFYGNTRSPWVSLTLDDGPDESVTPAVLDVLQRERVWATWFLIGERVSRHPEIAQAIVAAGHHVGNHFWTDTPGWRLSRARFQRDLARTETELTPLAHPEFLRPASGWIPPWGIREARARGYVVVLGSANCSDWMRPPDGFIRWAITHMARPGAILVLHVGPGREHTPRVLPGIIRGIRAKGLEFVPLTRLLAAGREGPE